VRLPPLPNQEALWIPADEEGEGRGAIKYIIGSELE
jgi:hypothetical protein